MIYFKIRVVYFLALVVSEYAYFMYCEEKQECLGEMH